VESSHSSRNCINEKLIYTHGYGRHDEPSERLHARMACRHSCSATIADPEHDSRSHRDASGRFSFGELTNTDVYVKTRQKEFKLPAGDANNLTSYPGQWRHRLGGWSAYAHSRSIADESVETGRSATM